MTRYLQQAGIKIVHPSSDKKAAIVERCNRTIQGILYRFLAHNQTKSYSNVLPDLIESYNTREHSTIKMTPTEAESPEKQQELLDVHNKRYTDILQKSKKPKYAVGELVLIQNLAKSGFRRGYDQSFNFEVLEIVEVKTNMPIPMYILKSMDDDKIVKGGFYAEELQPIKGDVFKIDTVLKKRKYQGKGPNRGKKQILVKWRGYNNPSHTKWINVSDVTSDYHN